MKLLINTKKKWKGLIGVACYFLISSLFASNAMAQDCDFYEQQLISFNAVSNSSDTEYESVYVLADAQNTIIELSALPVFIGQSTGDYTIYSINYEIASGISGLNIGNNVNAISSSCMDVSSALSISVCHKPACYTCIYDDFSINSQSVNGDPSYTTEYLIVNAAGLIVQVSDDTSFDGLTPACYSILSINYLDDGSIVGNQVGMTIDQLKGDCLDLGNSLGFQVCFKDVINVVGDLTICAGQSVILTAGSNAGNTLTWTWFEGGVLQTATGVSITVAPTENTLYTVTSGGGSCPVQESLTVFVTDQIDIDLGPNITLCPGESATLSINNLPASYDNIFWSTGELDVTSIVVDQVGVYTATVVTGICGDVASVEVFISSGPQITIEGNTEVCFGEEVCLTANGPAGTTYIWSKGESGSDICFTPLGSTNYTLFATGPDGCEIQISVPIVVNQLPGINITGESNICIGESTTLISFASDNDQLTWTVDGIVVGTSSSITVSPSSTTIYTLDVVDENGCSNSSSFEVNVTELDALDLGSNFTICQGESATITITNLPLVYDQIVWSTGATNVASINIFSAGVYSAVVTLGTCTISGEVEVFESTGPVVNVSGNTEVCFGEEVCLTANGPAGTTYVWSKGQMGKDICFTPSASTTYFLFSTDIHGCTSQTEVQIVVNQLPSVNITGTTSICEGESTVLNSFMAVGTTVEWSEGGVVFSSSPLIHVSPSETTSYVLVVTDQNGCQNSASITIKVEENPSFTLSDKLICASSALSFDLTSLEPAGFTGGNWQTNQSSINNPNNVTVFENQSYEYNFTNANNCEGSADLEFSFYNPVLISISGNRDLCPGEMTTLSVDQNGASYLWSNGETTQSITVQPLVSTSYSVSVTSSLGCINVLENILVSVDPNNCGVNCDYTTCDDIIINVSGGSTNGYSNQLVATDGSGTILYIFNSNNIGNLPAGVYTFYAVNSLDGSALNLQIGSNISDINGDCFDVSNALVFEVCQSDCLSIGSTIWNDSDNDGFQDASESGIADVIVQLYEDNNMDGIPDDRNMDGVFDSNDVVASTVSSDGLSDANGDGVIDANDLGFYSFNGLDAGNYVVVIPNAPQSPKSNGIIVDMISSTMTDILDNDQDEDDNGIQLDLNGDGITDGPVVSPSINLSPSAEPLNEVNDDNAIDGNGNATVDFGFFIPAHIGDLVWFDEGGMNSQYDPGIDTPLAGVTVSLLDVNGVAVLDANGNAITTQTDATGNYLFSGLAPGMYQVAFDLSTTVGGSAFTFVTPNVGSDVSDSDAIAQPNGTGLTGVITLNEGDFETDVDAGVRFGVVPVVLVNFNGRYHASNDANELIWIISSEINNEKFILERSLNEEEEFSVIAEIEGKGNSNIESTYNFDDFDVAESGVYLYRLSQQDYDGTITDLGIIGIRIEKEISSKVEIYPNPNNGQFSMNIDFSNDSEVQVSVYTINGKLVKENALNESIKAGSNRFDLNLTDLSAGSYLIRTKVANASFVKKLFIVNN